MEDTYKGESPSKKQARFLYWTKVLKILRNSFYSGHHMVLASREGGDICTLYGLEVDPRFIVAVEQNPSAAYAVQEKFPETKVVCSDAVRIAKEYRRMLASAYLDFCGHLTEKMINDITQVVQHGLKDDSILGVTILSGREKGEVAELVEEEKQALLSPNTYLDKYTDKEILMIYRDMSIGKNDEDMERVHRRASDALLSGDPIKIREEAQRIRTQHSAGFAFSAASIARMHYLMGALGERLTPFRTVIHPVMLYTYTSVTETSKGVPMASILFRIRRLNKNMPLTKFQQKSVEIILADGFTELQDCNTDMRGLRRQVLSYLRYLHSQRERGKYSEEAIQRSVARSSLLWNLSPETIIAWKAHQTRGTYEDE